MGKHKHWLLYNYKVAGDASGSAGFHATGKSPNSTGPNKNSAGKSRKRGGPRHISSSSSGGCMSAIFHLFNIQHHQFPFQQPPSLLSEIPINFPQEPASIILMKGVEAPRNSLELEEQQPMVEEEVASSSSSSSKIKQETNFNIPMGGIQIKTKRSRLMEDVSSEECSSSSPAGTKTPNLVARLMGLDLLPENSSPRPSLSSPRPSSSSSSHAYVTLNPLSKLSSHKNNTRSLPATPRISTTAARDVDYNHRLSLQINTKENKRTYDESSTSEYAKHIAKQVRENISRRVGADITNTMKKQKEQRRDELLVVLKPKRPISPPSSATVIDKSRDLDQGHLRGKENAITPVHSCSSPRQTLSEMKNNILNSDSAKRSSSLSSTEAPTTKLMKQEKLPVKVQTKCKRIMASEKYDLRLKRMNQQEDVFVKKLCNNKKSTPLSNHLVSVNLNVNTTTKFISFKKDMASSPASSTTQKQVPLASITQLPSCQNRSYNTNLFVKDDVSSNGNDVGTSSVSEYISRILSHSGIEKTTPISITQWYSPSHPLHPSIFNQLEKIFHPTITTTFADQKLIFEVVDELLVEILKPYICFKPWAYSSRRNSHRMYGSDLIEKLSEKISCLPAANCQVLEDIDGLIAGDMRSRNSTRVVGAVAFEEEAEELVAEMERDLVDTLVGEVALAVAGIIWHVGV